jgi:SP family general alpha glucoside:H+ symporter-like MFS transporter
MSSNIMDEKDLKSFGETQHVETLPFDHEAGGQRKGSVIEQDFGHYISDAAEAVEQQKGQTIREALKMYKWAIIYSVTFSA